MNDSETQNAADPEKKKRDDAALAKEQPSSATESKPSGGVSSPKPELNTASSSLTQSKSQEASQDSHDSDAETVVLPGKDGYSPSKTRKVRQEDQSENVQERGKSGGNRRESDDRSTDKSHLKSTRHSGSGDGDKLKVRKLARKDGSSGLSSAPSSPSNKRSKLIERTRKQRHNDSDDPNSSSSDESTKSGTRSMLKSALDKIRPGDKLHPQKRKAPKADSEDEADTHKSRRQRTASVGMDGGRTRDGRSKHASQTRSPSPHLRQHRRSISNSTPINGQQQRRKRLAVTTRTEYQSDDSSASDSPHPRTHTLRRLPPPLNASESTISPAKVGPHKKHLDAHGQTFLARACARGEFEGAKTRLRERPEDLNVADYAGNTPLQIAALHGSEEIVKLLIDAGCNLDCVNYDKETPLLDAVDNGHLGVVKLLLNAGVNPRKANVNGEEPIDRVTEDTDNGEEIRAALIEAKRRAGQRHRTSEERYPHTDQDMRDSNAPDSPRRSPGASALAAGRRGGTVRSTKTRNDLLYMPLDEKTLRQAAGRGDEETVARILQVKESSDDPESMVAAARGGHDLVIQLLLGLGGANPDPAPVSSLQPEFATPMLAAIGQENIKVVELLLEQQGFDPTRKFKGEMYHEIARRRQGTNWKEEEHLLKNASDAARRGKRKEGSGKVHKSPGRREDKRSRREEAESVKGFKRNASSPPREPETRRKSISSKASSPKEKRRLESATGQSEEQAQRRALARSKREEKAGASDREHSPGVAHKAIAKRIDSDVANGSSDGDTPKPRRKLISKGELRGEREKHHRTGLASNAPLSPHDGRHDESADKSKTLDKPHERLKGSKTEELREREGSTKRHRTSLTPDKAAGGKDDGEGPIKKRRVDSHDKDKRAKKQLSPEPKPRKTAVDGDETSKHSKQSKKSSAEDTKPEPERGEDPHRRESGRSSASDKPSVRVKSEDVDVEMPDVPPVDAHKDSESEQNGLDESSSTKVASTDILKEREKKRTRTDETTRGDETAQKQKDEEEQEQKEAQRKRAAEQAKKEQEEAEKKRAEAEEASLREQEEKKRILVEARRREEEEAAQKQRDEEERQHKEQLQREADEARRLREEEDRKHREQMDKLHREEMEKRRIAREVEARRAKEVEERARLDKLPALIRWLDSCPNPKLPVLAEKFCHIQGVRYDTINAKASGTVEGREQWILNTDVALVLGEKDLGLSRCEYMDPNTLH